jgi:hypothetical protein
MKKLLLIPGISILMIACNTMPEQNTGATQTAHQTISQQDTTGLAAYNAWKAQNELANIKTTQSLQQTQPASETRTIVKYVPVKTTSSKSVSHSSSSNSVSGSMNNESSQTAKVEQKKGWSKAAKGAVIGGVAGAAGGAIINKKNRVVGAVIGGVLGAAGGYGIGRNMDKNDGRIDLSTILN